ncbi:MAG TPA: hypothetical protein VN361_12195 [Oxalicibacterium sp.]|nr:hypothetical protein [Oxalicibacterium sp.]
MTRIDIDYASSAYSASAASNRKATSNFSDVLEGSVVKIRSGLNPIDMGAALSSDFASQLNAALRDYGIRVPPALRVTSGVNGLELVGDNRNAQFQAMLRDHAELASGFSALLGQAEAARKAALAAVMSAFAGDNSSASVSNFLDGFEASEKAAGFSVRFNGADATVEEKGEKAWQPVKEEKDFRMDLLRVYAEYLAKTQVISVSDQKKDKDDSADDALRKQLADAKEQKDVTRA